MRLDLVTQTKPDYRLLSNSLRVLSMDMVEHANSGHPGLPMGMADVATILFQDYLKFDPSHPDWLDRDRFVLSAGHGSALLYSLLYMCGYPKMAIDEIKRFRQLGSLTPGHPEYGHTPGVETTTGPLGQGFANAVGMALAERMLNARYGDDLINHYTYVIASDGDLMEGISHEALSFAGHYQLSKLIVFFDDNNISIDGKTDLTVSDNQLQRFSASHWHVQAIDGHDFDAIHSAIQAAQQSDRPSLIACRTHIAQGSPNKANTSQAHGSPLGADEVKATRHNLGWKSPEFVIPEDILLDWRLPGQRGHKRYESWRKEFNKLDESTQKRLFATPKDFAKIIAAPFQQLKEQFLKDKPCLATRVLSQKTLDVAADVLPELVGGSADLSPSNNTKARSQKPLTPFDFSGHYIHYGVREHAMAAMMNGMSVHKGLIPYGGTFLVFSDYLRPSLRLSALMEQPVIYVLTHDSIGLGEDGPTHQPIEHLAALRAIPNLHVFRPADAIEVVEAWELALSSFKTPSVLALTRQNLPLLRENVSENLSSRGGYVLKSTPQKRDITLIASGSEVHLAIEAVALLAEKNIQAAVVSVPCLDLFNAQNASYQQDVLGSSPRLFIEAALQESWYRHMRRNEKGEGMDAFIGMHSFGASGPIKDLFQHFGITTEAICAKAEALCSHKA